ncbi:MAG: hypothetical protein IPP10_15040 [Candidatus Competibacteraceae bacterium]|nr:hypothetical protein [Candidatus Competibacteraceae bacterium]
MSLERLIEGRGIALKQRGGSGRVVPVPRRSRAVGGDACQNLWHCFGCGLGGGVIDWVMKAEGVSFRHAVALLKGKTSFATIAVSAALDGSSTPSTPVKRATVRMR